MTQHIQKMSRHDTRKQSLIYLYFERLARFLLVRSSFCFLHFSTHVFNLYKVCLSHLISKSLQECVCSVYRTVWTFQSLFLTAAQRKLRLPRVTESPIALAQQLLSGDVNSHCKIFCASREAFFPTPTQTLLICISRLNVTVDKWSSWCTKSHLSLVRAQWCSARFHSSSGWSCLSSLGVFPCSAGTYSSAPPPRHSESAWALCPDLMSWGSPSSLPPGVGPSVCPHQSCLPGPHEAGPPLSRSRRGGAAAYRRWLGGVWVIWSCWACQVGLLWQCCSSVDWGLSMLWMKFFTCFYL